MRSLWEHLKRRPWRIDEAIAKSIRQGQGLRLSYEDRMFEINKSFFTWVFALVLHAHKLPLGITGA